MKSSSKKDPIKSKKNKGSRQNKNSQLSFLDKSFERREDKFGGSLLKSHPKIARPLVTNFPIHLVLTSNFSNLRLPKTYGKVHKELYRVAKKYGIKIYKYANVGNHLHLVIKLTKLKLWRGFIRELTSRIAWIVEDTLGAAKNVLEHKRSKKSLDKISSKRSSSLREAQGSISKELKFWKVRPFTRIIRGWKKAFKAAIAYVELNQWEAEGHISRKDIKTLRDLKALFAVDG